MDMGPLVLREKAAVVEHLPLCRCLPPGCRCPEERAGNEDFLSGCRRRTVRTSTRVGRRNGRRDLRAAAEALTTSLLVRP